MGRSIARVAIVLSLGIATMAFGALEKNVIVRIDGEPVGVRTHASTVAQALDRAGVALDEQDRVEPALEADLDSGDVIDVYRAKEVVLLLDGKPRRVIVTGLTIAEVIDEVNVRRTVIDTVHPARSAPVRPGMTISYERAVGLDVEHDGTTDAVITNASTVGEVLEDLGIDLGARDKVIPALDSAPVHEGTIEIFRIGYRRVIRTQNVGFETILRRDPGLEYGHRKVLQDGVVGLQRIVSRIKYVDGEKVFEAVLRTSWVRKPQDRIIAIGSGYPGCACNRGTQTGKASWYSQADGLTAAHRTLPIGTIVRVENLANGRWVNVRIVDRGPYVDGRVIDLSDEAFRRIGSLSRGVISVRIRW